MNERVLVVDGRARSARGDRAQSAPELIVLDLMLPDVHGEEIAARLRERSDVPILMLTAKAGEEQRLTGFALGADDYLVKPFSPRELVAPVDPAAFREPDRDLHERLNGLHLLAGILAAILAVVAAALVSIPLARPLRRLTEGARRMQQGDLATRVEPAGGAEMEQLAYALNRLAATLEREEELREEATADLAHELRTPLTGIISRIEAAQDAVLADESANLEAMHTEALRLNRLVSELHRRQLAPRRRHDVHDPHPDAAKVAEHPLIARHPARTRHAAAPQPHTRSVGVPGDQPLLHLADLAPLGADDLARELACLGVHGVPADGPGALDRLSVVDAHHCQEAHLELGPGGVLEHLHVLVVAHVLVADVAAVPRLQPRAHAADLGRLGADDVVRHVLELLVGRLLLGHLGHVDRHRVVANHVDQERTLRLRARRGGERRRRHCDRAEQRQGADQEREGGCATFVKHRDLRCVDQRGA